MKEKIKETKLEDWIEIVEQIPSEQPVMAEPILMQELVGKTIVITDYSLRESKYDNNRLYALCKILLPDKTSKICYTGNKWNLELLKKAQDKLPIAVTILQTKLRNGRTSYIFGYPAMVRIKL
jgi:hypothetical protein